MIQLDTSGIATFNKQLTLELARLDREISQEFAKWTQRIFMDLVKGTAQFSGDTASNWNYSLNAPDYSYNETPLKYEYAKPHSLLKPLHMGHADAVNTALSKMQSAAKPTWRDQVYFANATPAASLLEDQRIVLRPVNMLPETALPLDLLIRREQSRGLL